jgi:hypothetical protein
MYRISKGDLTVIADTEAELQIAIACLTEMTEKELPGISIPVKVNAPDWRVGGPRDSFPDVGTTASADQLPLMPGGHIEVDKPKLVAVQDREQQNAQAFSELHDLAEESRHYLQDDDAPSGRMHVDMGFDVPQYIPVSAKKLDVLEAVLLFPDGVPANGVAQLLGLTQKMASGRLQMLRVAGLAELVPHTNSWRATTLARRAKLVRS